MHQRAPWPHQDERMEECQHLNSHLCTTQGTALETRHQVIVVVIMYIMHVFYIDIDDNLLHAVQNCETKLLNIIYNKVIRNNI